jgi:hypothetical protein
MFYAVAAQTMGWPEAFVEVALGICVAFVLWKLFGSD